ncbi:hypothetical protein KEM60_00974 [Austwickia sp. TVS 96-490-7B]|uniref:glutaredoxin family protein n=1 Tax=Austwickia sp. TVS 96-490-7B TaxID=2830843 RepID=UPI001C579FEA|nr:glutaredoxin family protein [Austwickia sp. TVS 96-490-7B]MBW3084785.1 hypothetical protein [Austwickia sp. TVS 96-490-7B]
MSKPRVLLVTIPDCHLCDRARETLTAVAHQEDICWHERDLTRTGADDPHWWDEVPLILIDGVVRCRLRIDEDELREALRSPAATFGA